MLRGPLTDAGRERLRQAALRNRPWLQSTGPRTEAGKRRVAQNARRANHRAATERERRSLRRDVVATVSGLAMLLKQLLSQQPQ